eukprot:545687-Amphidinium_carterae.1
MKCRGWISFFVSSNCGRCQGIASLRDGAGCKCVGAWIRHFEKFADPGIFSLRDGAACRCVGAWLRHFEKCAGPAVVRGAHLLYTAAVQYTAPKVRRLLMHSPLAEQRP